MEWVTIARALTAGALMAGLSLAPSVATARDTRTGDHLAASISVQSLPPEGQETHRLIRAGGPFPYPEKDGQVFRNREQLLPRKTRGFYREYTVPTPASRNRGARRLVCGGQKPTAPEVCYYTQDHYASFRRVAE